MNYRTRLILLATLLLAACSNAPTRTGTGTSSAGSGGYLPGDGPGNTDAARLASVPDAAPHAEPLHRYANRPYEALGVRYVPLTKVGTYKERGIASWYGKKFHGHRTSSGEVYDMYAMTAAHKTLPIPSYARVTNLRNGKSVVVRVNDRGPFMHGRIIDLSYAAAYKLDLINSGSGEVEVESLGPSSFGPAPATVVAAPVQSVPVESVPVQTETIPVPSNASSGRVYLQLAAFRSRESAESFQAHMQDELGDLGKQIMLYARGGLTKVHLGPYRTAAEARVTANQLAPRLGFKPFVSMH